MNKQTVQLPGAQGMWDSFISKYQPDSQKVLDNMFTAGSKNFVTDQTGMIDKRQGGVVWNRTSFSGPANDSYEAVFESGARHYLRVGQGVLSASTGNGLFNSITSGYASFANFEWATYQDRVYGDNGVNPPQVYDTITNYGGVPYSFTTGKTKIMGAQAPTMAPVAATPTSGGGVPPGPHRYEVTFMYYGSEESNGSPASNVETATGILAEDTTKSIFFVVSQVTDLTHLVVSSTVGMTAGDTITQTPNTTTITSVTDATHLVVGSTSGWSAGNNTIALSSIPIGGYGVTARNIYRDNNDGVFLLLDTIPNNTATTYTDTLYQGSTPTPIPTDNGVPPSFSKIALWLDALWITPTGNTNTLFYSQAGSPDIFPANNFVVCQSDDVITAIEVYNGTLYVWGLHSFGSIQGNTPDTFYYYNISTTVGCTDNRSIQIRSVVSVPTLWWLSDKGIYYSNGYTVEYGSDLIQDLVNLNVAQVNYSLGRNTQNSQAQYEGDTFTPGIDITSIPGTITTIAPEADYSTTADWLGGSVVTNLKTSDQNLAEVPTVFAPGIADGNLGGSATTSGNDVTLPPTADWVGGNSVFSGLTYTMFVNGVTPHAVAERIFIPRAGTFTSVSFYPGADNGNGIAYLGLLNDSFGTPGSSLGTFPVSGVVGNPSVKTASLSIHVNSGFYWLVCSFSGTYGGSSNITSFRTDDARQGPPGWQDTPLDHQGYDGSHWAGLFKVVNGQNLGVTIWSGYTFVSDVVASTGTWTSPIYDCGAVSSVPNTITLSGSYPSPSSSTVTVYTSASSGMSAPNTQVISSPNGTYSLTLTGLRYWQVIIEVDTSDNRQVPLTSVPVLLFSTTAIWVSQPINATSDNTGWGTLTFSGNVPAGTSVALSMATSPDNITYSSFGPIGSALTEPWAKVMFVLMTDAGDTTSPSISEVTLTWSLMSTIESSAIDTGVTPAGFSTMQFVENNLSAGTVTMYIRTATTALGLSSASYVMVPNGTFPNLTPDEFVQWKLVLTAMAGSSPQITSVTVNWFISSGVPNVRCASLFYNKTYYLSVATIGATFNNTLIQLDQFGKWRIQKDQSVGTLLLYFNNLYFTDGTNGNIYNGFIAPTDNGTPITMDVRTKAWHEADDIFLKVPRALKITGIHTGTFIHAYYSTDRGNTFIEMFNELGEFGYQTNNSQEEFVTLFVPDADTLEPGRTLMYRIVSADVFPCSIINFEPTMYSRKGRYLNNG